MPPTTGYSLGDVILVLFPFTEQAGTKKRLAVIISSATYSTLKRDLVIMAITSQLSPSGALGEALVANWQAAGLTKPSAIKPVITPLSMHWSFEDSASLRLEISRFSGTPSPLSSGRLLCLLINNSADTWGAGAHRVERSGTPQRA